MHGFQFCSTFAVAAGLLALTSGSALAQEQTTATYENWTVRCAMSAGTPLQRLCDMEQVSQFSGKKEPFSRVVISRTAKGQPARITVQVPVNVWLADGVKIMIDGKPSGLAGPFTRCLPGGCFAGIEIRDTIIYQFRTATAPAQIVYASAENRQVVIPLSFKGFAEALDVLQKQ